MVSVGPRASRRDRTTTPPKPAALLARNAASNTAASLAEIARSSRSVWTGAAARRATPFDLATRGAQWWTSMTDRRVLVVGPGTDPRPHAAKVE